jgi:2-methylfumaryl-CoA isomerase
MTIDAMLRGLRIVEVSAFIAAPFCGMTLAQLGADVIRVDPVGGGPDRARWPLAPSGASLYWAGLNKAKRSICLDLENPAGRAIFDRLVARAGADAGIVVTNYPQRGALDYARLKTLRHDLIMVGINGHRDGRTAVDYTVNCATGLPLATGDPRARGPINSVLPAWDVATGLTAALAVLAALRARDRTGRGGFAQLALADVALGVVSALGLLGEAELCDRDRPRIGNHLYGALGCELPTRDGRHVMVVAISLKQWRALVAATAQGEAIAALERRRGLDFHREEDRYAVRDELQALFASWSRARDLAAIAESFDRHGVCWGPYRSFRQVIAEDPSCGAEGELFERIDTPGIGPMLTARSPLAFDGKAATATPAPGIGADTRALLAGELGLSDVDIDALRDAGAIGEVLR